MNDTLSIDGFGPLPVVRPDSVAGLGDIVRQASSERPLYPLGGGTQLSIGMAPTILGTAVDLRGLDQIVEFPARDMTITVGAGMTIARLQEILAPENLRLPLDIPRAAEATLGGALAANVSGSRRFGYGTGRDYVIGISAVNDEGREFKAGGRVVKNVAGYDLCKLLVGSFGTLGMITQVTLKLRPLAEEQAIVCIPCTHARLGPLLDEVLASRTRPVICDVINRPGAMALGESGGSLANSEAVALVGYEGNTDAVKWQIQQLIKEMKASVTLEARVGSTSRPLDRALAEWPSLATAKMTLKASMLPSRVAEFFAAAPSWGGEPLMRAHAGNGIVVGHFTDELAVDAARGIVDRWRAAANVVVQKCPPDWKPSLNVWGPPPADIAVQREVKAKFDPRGIFNPGRFVV